jgi:hypothetical protein
MKNILLALMAITTFSAQAETVKYDCSVMIQGKPVRAALELVWDKVGEGDLTIFTEPHPIHDVVIYRFRPHHRRNFLGGQKVWAELPEPSGKYFFGGPLTIREGALPGSIDCSAVR